MRSLANYIYGPPEQWKDGETTRLVEVDGETFRLQLLRKDEKVALMHVAKPDDPLMDTADFQGTWRERYERYRKP